jgi:uncharacterized protein (TIGR02466 family)
MIINGIFPTPVACYDLSDSDEMNKGLSEYILSIEADEKAEGNFQFSMVGQTGYHTKDDLLLRDNPFVDEFVDRIRNEIATYWSAITDGSPLPANTRLVAWAMIYRKGDYTMVHNHPEANLSITYYPKVPEGLSEGSDINDNKPKEGSLAYIDPRPAARYDGSFSAESTSGIIPKEGTGIIIPGWLEHFVVPHQSENIRICIAMNVFMPKGEDKYGRLLEES